ncbi:hypothetical protein SDC9_27711 [bioreactor metagenome]|uniref:Uncharacterized protein n=1 Tax=bioreactor metagenome TaxID=1076179 RepID=A0A644USE7_9ZZZZ
MITHYRRLVYIRQVNGGNSSGGKCRDAIVLSLDGQAENRGRFKIQSSGVVHCNGSGCRADGECATGVSGGNAVSQGLSLVGIRSIHGACNGSGGSVFTDAEGLVAHHRRLVYIRQVNGGNSSGGKCRDAIVLSLDGQAENRGRFKIQSSGVVHCNGSGCRADGECATGVSGGNAVSQGLSLVGIRSIHGACNGSGGSVFTDAEGLVAHHRS